jgi:hypothetical protein
VADASAYGQLSMNLSDATAAAELVERAPRTHAWLCGIRDGAHVGETGSLSGPSLYFEVRKGSEPLDPADWLVKTLRS